MISIARGLAIVLALALVASLAPVPAYALSLAAFGMPHVLAEMRYVDGRFRPRLRLALVKGMALLLGLVLLARLARLEGTLSRQSFESCELALLALLIVMTLPTLSRAGLGRLALGIAILGAVALGLLRAPGATFVILALLHNLTPIGFLAERVSARARPKVLAACSFAFLAVPALIIGGIPGQWFADAIAAIQAFSPFAGLDLDRQIGVFVPEFWRDESFAPGLFSAAVYLQLLHYAVVLHLLPRLLSDEDARRATIVWPSRSRFLVFLVLVAIGSCAAFALSFSEARLIYGVFAALHAWIEVPVLLLATSIPEGAPADQGLKAART